MQVTALILVTSTVSMMLFYQLPAAVIDPKDTAALTLAADYGQSMTLFWAAMFTMTLMAGFGPVLLIGGTPRDDRAEGAVMTFEGFRKQMSAFLAVLAPLIVGALGPVFELITKAI